jgi:hypothetical protein
MQAIKLNLYSTRPSLLDALPAASQAVAWSVKHVELELLINILFRGGPAISKETQSTLSSGVLNSPFLYKM